MSARALCESVQKIARTRESAMRHDRVERVAPLGGLLWIGVFDSGCGGTQLGERDDGVHDQALVLDAAIVSDPGPAIASSSSTNFNNCCSRGRRCDLTRLKRTCLPVERLKGGTMTTMK